MDYFHIAFYFILLFLCPLVKAAESQEAKTCGEEVCGNVKILSPFGIHDCCYNNSWFRVTCNQTLNGEKPFISINDIDVEVLGSLFPDTILIAYPVTYVGCDRKTDVGVNLTGTPFFFPSKYNYFGSVGCGNLAFLFRNENDPLGGCVQPKCDEAPSESGCFIKIYKNFTSYTVNISPLYSNGCSSGFMFSRKYFHKHYPLPIGINIQITHVPTTIMWNSTL